MKNLVIVTHPDIENSIINRAWVQALNKHPDHFILHSLYEKYPDLDYDVAAEQEVLSRYEHIIFQFPIHWFSTPFALKKYVDEVFTYGWAFGPNGDKLKGKKIGFAVSTGGDKDSYESSTGLNVESLLNDFQLTFQYCGCTITQLHLFHGAMFEPSKQAVLTNAECYVNSFMMKTQELCES